MLEPSAMHREESNMGRVVSVLTRLLCDAFQMFYPQGEDERRKQ